MAGEIGALVIGGVTVPVEALLDFRLERAVAGSETVLEFSDLTMDIQVGPTAATKRTLTITSGGWAPPGLDALARTTSHSVSWAELTGLGAWTTRTGTFWILARPRYTEDLREGGGYQAWTLTLREA